MMQRQPSSPRISMTAFGRGPNVATTDDMVHTGSADLREHGAQSHLIRVDIRNQGNTRHRNDLGDYSVW